MADTGGRHWGHVPPFRAVRIAWLLQSIFPNWAPKCQTGSGVPPLPQIPVSATDGEDVYDTGIYYCVVLIQAIEKQIN